MAGRASLATDQCVVRRGHEIRYLPQQGRCLARDIPFELARCRKDDLDVRMLMAGHVSQRNPMRAARPEAHPGNQQIRWRHVADTAAAIARSTATSDTDFANIAASIGVVMKRLERKLDELLGAQKV
jgi:hypothetical protein